MNNKQNQIPALPGDATEKTPFKGYTIEEIKYQRALAALRKEFCKAKLNDSLASMNILKPKAREDKLPSKSAVAMKAGKMAMKLFSNMNTLDYVLMGISLLGTVKKGYRLLRGRKKGK